MEYQTISGIGAAVLLIVALFLADDAITDGIDRFLAWFDERR